MYIFNSDNLIIYIIIHLVFFSKAQGRALILVYSIWVTKLSVKICHAIIPILFHEFGMLNYYVKWTKHPPWSEKVSNVYLLSQS